MPQSTFRVTASTGGWRSLPWPFGIVEVSDSQLSIRSTGLSWWVPDRCVDRDRISSVTTHKTLGATRFKITVVDAPPITVLPGTSATKFSESLRSHGFPTT